MKHQSPKRRRGKTRSHNHARLDHNRPLRFEPLEDRRMLSITVDTLADVVDPNDGFISLREAIATANTTPGADTIDVATALTIGGPAKLETRLLPPSTMRSPAWMLIS
jgi:CSLREA domain-containing protein